MCAALSIRSAFKEEYENELRGEFGRKKSSLEIQNANFKTKLQEVVSVNCCWATSEFHQQKSLDNALKESAALREQLRVLTQERDRLLIDKSTIKSRFTTGMSFDVVVLYKCLKRNGSNETGYGSSDARKRGNAPTDSTERQTDQRERSTDPQN
jgi:hypothetical protein